MSTTHSLLFKAPVIKITSLVFYRLLIVLRFLPPPATNSNHTTRNTAPWWTWSPTFWCPLCKWVTSSSLAGKRNEVVLSAVEECYFGQQVLQGLYWPRVSVDLSGLGHHQGAYMHRELCVFFQRWHCTWSGGFTSASRDALNIAFI